MINVRTTEDIYPALREIIEELQKTGLEEHAVILTHRMTKVAWTSQGELFEELIKVLSDVETTKQSTMPTPLLGQVRVVLQKLREVV
jgi:hypothetical protein